jgi:predicted unusual protein kinase regulating ubiquinone biosynthesis (AarF/ABC1/UbiB family)
MFLFLNGCLNIYKYIKYFILFNHLILYISFICVKKYYNLTITNNNIDTLIDLIKINGCLTIKFAQWYSSRLPHDDDTTPSLPINSIESYILERFTHIFYDNNNIHSLKYTKKLFKKTTGDDIDNVLIFNNTIPISSGSIAQVYDCTLKSDGRRVAVKIKHPDLEHQIFFPKLLINICLFLLNFFKLTIYIPFNLDNFFDTLYKQLDFNEESKNLHIFKKNFADSNLIIIPESIYNNYDIIIMSYEEGIFYENIDSTTCNDFHKFKMNFTLFMFVMQCFLIDGINHADLHNGNWKVRFNPELNEYQIIIYDAGVVYHSNIQSMQDLIFAYDSNNIDAFIKILIRDNYILNLNDDNRDMIYNLLHERLVPVIRRPFDFTFIIFEAIDILKTEKFYIDGEFLTIIIGISLVEKHFKKYKIMGDCHHIDENHTEEMKNYDYDFIRYNDYVERINFCDTKNNFKKISDLFKSILHKLKKEKRINSFDNLNKNTQNIKFLDVSLFSKSISK